MSKVPPAPHELDVGKGVAQPHDFDLGETVLDLQHELPPQGPLVRGLVGTLILVYVPI